MSEVRALLKAKRQEARIEHPYASYNSSNQLKCILCGTIVKHASAWEGHLGSKAHRTQVTRQREEERLERERLTISEVERSQEVRGQPYTADSSISSKRKTPVDDIEDEPDEKRRKVDEGNALPPDFFSDPSRIPDFSFNYSDEDGPITLPPPPKPDLPKTAIDLEYESFQSELTKATDSLDAYNRATVMAEPVIAPTSIPGFPTTHGEEKIAEPSGPTEAETRQKKEQEERELIMDRLLDEERAQEDADTRVLLLKTKVADLRQRRQEAKLRKSQANSDGS